MEFRYKEKHLVFRHLSKLFEKGLDPKKRARASLSTRGYSDFCIHHSQTKVVLWGPNFPSKESNVTVDSTHSCKAREPESQELEFQGVVSHLTQVQAPKLWSSDLALTKKSSLQPPGTVFNYACTDSIEPSLPGNDK